MQGRWGYINKLLYHRSVGTGLTLRKSKEKDIVLTKQQHFLTKLHDGLKMIFGVLKLNEASLFLRIFTINIIILHIFCMYMKYVRAFLVYKILKQILPIKVYHKLRLMVQSFQYKNY